MFGVSHPLYYYYIEGCIFPSSQSLSCGLEAPSAIPHLESKANSIRLDVLKTSLDEYEKYTNLPVTCSIYWKPKLIFQVLNASSIVSMSIFPVNCAEKAILFVQKGIIEEGTTGFFAPYLSEEQQEKWKAQPQLPNIHNIRNEETIQQSLTGLDEEVCQDIKACLKYFLIDRCTKAIVLTYKKSSGEINSLGWQKV